MVSRFVAERRERGNPWRRLVRLLLPVDRAFFPLFDLQAGLAVEGLQALVQLLADVRDPEGRVRDIEAIEKRADGVVDEVRAMLGRSLFPPFSRATSYDLVNRLDDVLDVTEDAAQSIHLYHVTAVPPEAQRLAELALQAALGLQQAIVALERIEQPRALLTLCAQVDELEARADHVLRSAMSRLFREEDDAREIIRLKAIYEVLESLTDRCKDVANEIESIVLKHG
jgi:predicted phosphate transport protein (TIGR00153 family)